MNLLKVFVLLLMQMLTITSRRMKTFSKFCKENSCKKCSEWFLLEKMSTTAKDIKRYIKQKNGENGSYGMGMMYVTYSMFGTQIMFGTEFMLGTNRQLFLMHCTEHKLRAEIKYVVPNILLVPNISCRSSTVPKLGFPLKRADDLYQTLFGCRTFWCRI